jgi:hypothetical protein
MVRGRAEDESVCFEHHLKIFIQSIVVFRAALVLVRHALEASPAAMNGRTAYLNELGCDALFL